MSIDDENMSVFFERIKESIEERSLKEINLENIENLPLGPNESIHVADFSKNELILHRGFQNFLGYSDDEVSIKLIRSLYHPVDADLVNRVFRATALYTMEHPQDSLNNELMISLRVKKKDGSYVKIISKSTIIEVDQNNRMLYVFNRFTDISFMDHTDIVNWEFKTKNLNKEEFKKLVYQNEQNYFTKKELEIIREIANDKSSKEIADKLNISIHTVATHRKKIYKKCNCHKPAELILFCKSKGLL